MFEKTKSLAKSIFKKSADSVTWIFKAPSDYESSFNWSKTKGLGLYEISLYLNRALNKRADKVGEIEFVLKQSGKAVENDWISLLRKPNKYQSGFRFWKLYQKYKDIFGEAYILKVYKDDEKIFKSDKAAGDQRIPVELKLLEPYLITKTYNADRSEIVSFKYSGHVAEQKEYSKDDLVYSFNPDPRNQLEGESLIRSGLRSLEVETVANEYQAKAIKTGGKIDTLIKVKDATSEDQINSLRDRYRKLKEQMWEDGNVDDPMFAGGDMDVLRLSLNPAELSYLESRKMAVEDIVALTNVPKSLLGLTSGETFANADSAIKIFLREVIKPLMVELTDDLDWQLIPKQFDLEFIDPTPAEREEVRQNIKLASDIYAVSTNEKRKLINDLLGTDLADVPNGGDVLAPINLMPLSDGQSTLPTDAEMAKKKELMQKKHPLSDEKKRDAFRKSRAKTLDAAKKRVRVFVRDFFGDQEQRVIAYLQKALKVKLAFDDAFSMAIEIRLAKAGIMPLIKDLFIQAGQEHLLYLGSDKEFNYTSAVDTSLEKRAEFFAQKINETQFNKLKRAFDQSAENGETRDQLVARIQGVYQDVDEVWSEVIARTEAHTALMGGTLEAIKQADMPLKIWIWGPGIKGGIRDDHVSMDGQERPSGMDFDFPSGARAQAPGLSGEASEDISCECWVA